MILLGGLAGAVIWAVARGLPGKRILPKPVDRTGDSA